MKGNFIWVILVVLGLLHFLLRADSGISKGGGKSPRSLFFIKSRMRRRRLDASKKDNIISTNVPSQVRRHRHGMFKF